MYNQTKKKIVVCGATGNQGGAVAAALLSTDQFKVAALTRDLGSAAARKLNFAGAQVIQADTGNMASLLKAFEGAYGVFAMTQPWNYNLGLFDTGAELRQAKNIIWACKEAGVQEVVFSTVLNINGSPSGVPWIDNKVRIEQIVRAYLPEAVILKPALYMENIGTALLRITKEVIRGRFDPDQKVPYVGLDDIGKMVMNVLREPFSYRGKTIVMAGELLSGNEIADGLSEISGDRVIHYRADSEALLRLFKPVYFRMRRYFELQGRLLQEARQTGENELIFFSDRLQGHLAANAAKLFSSGP